MEGAGLRAAVARQEGSEAGRGGEAAGAAGEGVAQGKEGEVRWRYEGMRDELWGEQVAREGDLVEDDVDGVGVLCDGGEWIVFDGGKRRERTLMARRAGAGDADSSAPEGWAGSAVGGGGGETGACGVEGTGGGEGEGGAGAARTEGGGAGQSFLGQV